MKTNWSVAAIAIFFVCCDSGDSGDGLDNRVVASDTAAVQMGEGKPDIPVSKTEKVGRIEIVPVEVREFKKLSLSAKKRIYHHALAAREGDAIFYHQLGPMNLVIKRVLDGIGEAGHKVPLQLRRKIEPYSRLFSIHHGNYDSAIGEKILPTFIPGELAAAAQIAANAGIDLGVDDFRDADLGANQLERLEAFLESMRPWIFDRDVDSKITKSDGQVTEPTYSEEIREGVAPGMLSDRRASVIRHLRNGLPVMRQDEKAAMEQLIVSFQTGDRASLTRYLELWVKTESEIETIIGFSAPHLDPRSRPGTFGAMVMMRDKDLSDLMHKAAGMAAHYRQQMPWGKLHKRGAFEPSAPSAYNVVVAAGNAGPFTKNTMEVPMDPKKVKRVGQRRLYFSNIADARDRVFAKKMIVEFSPSPEVANRRIRWHRVARNDFLVLTEVIGRGMIKGGLNRGFGAYFKPLEEMLVELAALVLVFDPKNQEIGLVPTEESAKAIYDSYVSAMLEQLAEVGDSATLGQPKMRAKQAIVRFIVAQGAAEVISEGGHFFVRVTDYQAMRKAIRELLLNVHRIVTSGDVNGGKRLIMDFGTAFPLGWRDDVQRRFAKLGLPSVVAFSYPTLVSRLDNKGEIVDVVLR